MDQIQAAHDKECSKFQSKIAELEEQCGKQQETAVHEMAKIQEHHNQQMGDLVARYARHNLHTDVVRLQSRLEAKEVCVCVCVCVVDLKFVSLFCIIIGSCQVAAGTASCSHSGQKQFCSCEEEGGEVREKSKGVDRRAPRS